MLPHLAYRSIREVSTKISKSSRTLMMLVWTYFPSPRATNPTHVARAVEKVKLSILMPFCCILWNNFNDSSPIHCLFEQLRLKLMFTSSFSQVTDLALGYGFWFSSLFLVSSVLRFDTAIILAQTNLFNHTREFIIKSSCHLPMHFIALLVIGKFSIFFST